MSNRYIDRPPRIQPDLPVDTVEVPPPPRNNERGNQNFLQALAPIVTILLYIIVTSTGQGRRSMAFLLPMAAGVLISTGITVYVSWRAARQTRRKRQDYEVRLVQLRKEMLNQHEQQRSFYHYNYPASTELMMFNGTHRNNRSGSRLWERRTQDFDFGHLRLGVGVRASTFTYTLQTPDENDEDTLLRDAQRLVEDSQYVDGVPITLPIFHHRLDNRNAPNEFTLPGISPHHIVGIAGLPQHSYAFVRAMLAHFAAFHSPNDTRLYLMGLEEAKPQWEWITALPHIQGDMEWADKMDGARGGLLNSRTLALFEPYRSPQMERPDREHDGIAKFWKQIWSELDRRARRLEDMSGGQDNLTGRLPLLVIVVDLLPSRPDDPNDPLANATLNDLESEAAIALIIQRGHELGASVIFLTPDRRKIPSSCQAVIELVQEPQHQTTRFLYAETGLNTTRYVGEADIITNTAALQTWLQSIAQQQVRRVFGADMPRTVSMLELFDAERVTDIPIRTHWTESIDTKEPDWITFPIGIVAGREKRRLKFSADHDGVHGLVAGATGAGKSELLMTLILAIAMRYDPSIVNFVLVDYKGGAAFDPFDNLPHVVDKVTNLSESAVARMFAAIQAELDRRQRLNQKHDVKHIVEYRKQGYHHSGQSSREFYPHLFIIIDEFAEMITTNKEFKAQLDSITRLGRSLGVTLILAAQRPTGVSDQMRANIKLRMCLRVETKEESNEMLRRPDASNLPSIPGRGYVQVGSETLQEIQVGYSGESYTADDYTLEMAEIVKRLRDEPLIWLDELQQGESHKLYAILVNMMSEIAGQRAKPNWRKPWPDPLPTPLRARTNDVEEEGYSPLALIVSDTQDYLVHNQGYLQEEGLELLEHSSELVKQLVGSIDSPIALSPALAMWNTSPKEQSISWPGADWSKNPMTVAVGLIDEPQRAQLRVLEVRLQRGPYAVFGTSGSGKTTFLRTLLINLAAHYAPDELHFYVLDFANRNLEGFRDLPHTGAYIQPDDPDIEARVARLLRTLSRIVNSNREAVVHQQTDTLYSYNLQQQQLQQQNEANTEISTTTTRPITLVVIDNFAGFKENFDNQVEALRPLIREGLPLGVHFIVTVDQLTALGKLGSLFTERVALRMLDKSDYSNILNATPPPMDELPGRGYCVINRVPLVAQVALPFAADSNEASEKAMLEQLSTLAAKMQEAWNGVPERQLPDRLPYPVDILKDEITLRSILDSLPETEPLPPRAVLGRDEDLEVQYLRLADNKPHFIVSGTPFSGKTTVLQTWVLSLAKRYTPDEVGIVLVDRLRHLADIDDDTTLAGLPHLLEPDVVSEPDQFEYLIARIEAQIRVGLSRRIYIFIDNFDDFEELLPKDKAQMLMDKMGNLARLYGAQGLHFILAGSSDILKGSTKFLRAVRSSHFGMGMDANSAESSPLNARVPRNLQSAELPMGRGFLVTDGRLNLFQVAIPILNGNSDISTKDWIADLCNQYSSTATWEGEIITEELADEPLNDANGTAAVTNKASGDRSESGNNATCIEALRRVLQDTYGLSPVIIQAWTSDMILEKVEYFGIDIQTIKECQ